MSFLARWDTSNFLCLLAGRKEINYLSCRISNPVLSSILSLSHIQKYWTSSSPWVLSRFRNRIRFFLNTPKNFILPGKLKPSSSLNMLYKNFINISHFLLSLLPLCKFILLFLCCHIVWVWWGEAHLLTPPSSHAILPLKYCYVWHQRVSWKITLNKQLKQGYLA